MVAQRIQIPLTLDGTSLNDLLGSDVLGGLANILLPTLTTATLEGLSPVHVVPSRAEIAAATILSSVEPARDVVCSICQDHEPPEASSTQWRILRHCNHRFHKDCIDQWFQQNVHCPVCRYDIREDSEGDSDAETETIASDI